MAVICLQDRERSFAQWHRVVAVDNAATGVALIVGRRLWMDQEILSKLRLGKSAAFRFSTSLQA